MCILVTCLQTGSDWTIFDTTKVAPFLERDAAPLMKSGQVSRNRTSTWPRAKQFIPYLLQVSNEFTNDIVDTRAYEQTINSLEVSLSPSTHRVCPIGLGLG